MVVHEFFFTSEQGAKGTARQNPIFLMGESAPRTHQLNASSDLFAIDIAGAKVGKLELLGDLGALCALTGPAEKGARRRERER